MAGEKTDQPAAPDIEVVDAEIVEEQPAVKPPEPEPKTVEEVQPPKSGGGKAGWVVSGLLAAFIAGIIAAPYGEQGLRRIGILAALPVSDSRDIDAGGEQERMALRSRLDDVDLALVRYQEMLAQQSEQLTEAAQAREQITGDIALIASRPGGVAPESAANDIQAIRERLQSLTDEVARLASLSASETPEVAGLSGSLALARAETAQLKSRMQTLEIAITDLQAGSLNVSPRGRLLLVVGRLKDQIAQGLPLAGELDALRVDLAELPALDQQLIGADVAVLAKYPDGIAPYEVLVRDFGPVASAVKRAQEKEDGSFLASLFTVRRTDESAIGIDAVLLASERRLAARDVAGALEEMAALTGNAADAATDWRIRAQGHAEATAAVDRLQRTIANSTPGGTR